MPRQPNSLTRLNKFLALALGISRRQADDLIASGQIVVNKTTAILGQRITKTDTVYKNGTLVKPQAKFTYLILNKPIGYLSSRKSQGNVPTLYERLPKQYQALKTVGRLDKDSSGLILLTNDGVFTYQMTHPKFVKTKVYEVTLDKPLEPLHQQMISDIGLDLPDGKSRLELTESPLCTISGRSASPSLRVSSLKTRRDSDSPEIVHRKDSTADFSNQSFSDSLPDARRANGDNQEAGSPLGLGMPLGSDRLDQADEAEKRLREKSARTHWQVTMHEGRNRQIRRTFAALGYKVIKLHRTQFGKYQLGSLKPGEWQLLP